MLSDQNCDSLKKLTFRESAVSRLTQSRMRRRLVERRLIVAVKKAVAKQGAVAATSTLPLSLIYARFPLTFFWIFKVEMAKTERVRSKTWSMT